MALIDQPPVIKKNLAHVGLATKALTEPEDPVWLPKKATLRGPPDELFPPGLDEAGLPVELEAIDPDPDARFFDDLPADKWAA